MSEQLSFEDELKKALDREPFVPFTIILTSGDRYDVLDPWSVAIGASTVVVFPPGSAHDFFRKSQIVAVEVHAQAA